MHFNLVDAVVERSDRHIVTIKQVSAAEEYLQDHFPGFPVLPGVMMIESIVQAGRLLLEPLAPRQRMVLGSVRALKYGRFVRPGDALRIEVSIWKALEDGAYELRAEGIALQAWRPSAPAASASGEVPRAAVAGKVVLRPLRLGGAQN
jgi:3-hydroxyacyl-[acyl-carrier-protein] dehydratase